MKIQSALFPGTEYFIFKDKREINKIHKSFYIFCLNRFNNLSTTKKHRHFSVPTRTKHGKCVLTLIKFSLRLTKISIYIGLRKPCKKPNPNLGRNRNAVSRSTRHNLLLKVGERYKRENKRRKSPLEQKKKETETNLHPKVETTISKGKQTPKAVVSINTEVNTFDQNTNNKEKQKHFSKGKTKLEQGIRKSSKIPKGSNSTKTSNNCKKSKISISYKPRENKKQPVHKRRNLRYSGEEKTSLEKPQSVTSRNKEKSAQKAKRRGTNGTDGDEVLFGTNSTSSKKGKKKAQRTDKTSGYNSIGKDTDGLDNTKQRISDLEKDLTIQTDNDDGFGRYIIENINTRPEDPTMFKEAPLQPEPSESPTIHISQEDLNSANQSHFSKLLYKPDDEKAELKIQKETLEETRKDLEPIKEKPVENPLAGSIEETPIQELIEHEGEEEEEEEEDEDSQIPLLFVDVRRP